MLVNKSREYVSNGFKQDIQIPFSLKKKGYLTLGIGRTEKYNIGLQYAIFHLAYKGVREQCIVLGGLVILPIYF